MMVEYLSIWVVFTTDIMTLLDLMRIGLVFYVYSCNKYVFLSFVEVIIFYEIYSSRYGSYFAFC